MDWDKKCACHFNLQQPPHSKQFMNYSYLFIFISAWEDWDCDWVQLDGTVMYAVCIWAVLLRQHKGMKPKAVIMWVILRSSLSIFSLFSNGMPPTQGSNYPHSGVLLWLATYIHPYEVFIFLLSAFTPDIHLRIPLMPCRVKDEGGEWA